MAQLIWGCIDDPTCWYGSYDDFAGKAIARTPDGRWFALYTLNGGTSPYYTNLCLNYNSGGWSGEDWNNKTMITNGSSSGVVYSKFPTLLVDHYGTLHILHTDINGDPEYFRKELGQAVSSGVNLLTGKTWQMQPAMCIIPEGGRSGYDAIIIAGIESNSGNLYWAYSNDNGQTWTDNQGDTSTFASLDWGASKEYPSRATMEGQPAPGSGKKAVLFVRGENNSNAYIYGLFYDHSSNSWSSTYLTAQGEHYNHTYDNCWLSSCVDLAGRYYCFWSKCGGASEKLTYVMATGTEYPSSSWSEHTVWETGVTGSTLGTHRAPGICFSSYNSDVWFVFTGKTTDSLNSWNIYFRVRTQNSLQWLNDATYNEDFNNWHGQGVTDHNMRTLQAYGGISPYTLYAGVMHDKGGDSSSNGELEIHALLLNSFALTGSMTTDVKDLTDKVISLDALEWESVMDETREITVKTRTGSTPAPSAGWEDWTEAEDVTVVREGDESTIRTAEIASSVNRYFQAKFEFETTDNNKTPTLYWWKVKYSTRCYG